MIKKKKKLIRFVQMLRGKKLNIYIYTHAYTYIYIERGKILCVKKLFQEAKCDVC